MPALGLSLFLLAIGAILMWAVNVTSAGAVNIHMIGGILFAVGVIGTLMALLFWTSFAPFGTHEEIVHEDVHLR